MGTWFCYECDENIGSNESCPYCGTHRLGDMVMNKKRTKSTLTELFGRKSKGVKQSMFSEEQKLIYGIHPDDEMYRKIMELNILGKDYQK